jgi:hypothetical protein
MLQSTKDDTIKITVVDERLENPAADSKAGKRSGRSPQVVTVVDEETRSRKPTGSFVFLRWPLLLVASCAMAMALGYLAGSRDYSRFNDAPANPNAERSATGNYSPAYYHTLSNAALREAGLAGVSELRQFILTWGVKEAQAAATIAQEMTGSLNDKAKQDLWHAYVAESTLLSESRNREYDEQFRVNAILLHNELISRQPDVRRRNNAYLYNQEMLDPMEMREVMADLAHLTESLLSP